MRDGLDKPGIAISIGPQRMRIDLRHPRLHRTDLDLQNSSTMAPMPSDVVVPQLASQQEVGVSGRHLAGWDAITFVQPGSGQERSRRCKFWRTSCRSN